MAGKRTTHLLIDNPDISEELTPSSHCVCGAELATQTAVVKERRQQSEIPEPKTIVTEYRLMQVVVYYTVACFLRALRLTLVMAHDLKPTVLA